MISGWPLSLVPQWRATMWEAFPYLAALHVCLRQKPWLAASAARLKDSALVYDSGDGAVAVLIFM